MPCTYNYVTICVLQSDSSSQLGEVPRPMWQEKSLRTPDPLSRTCERVWARDQKQGNYFLPDADWSIRESHTPSTMHHPMHLPTKTNAPSTYTPCTFQQPSLVPRLFFWNETTMQLPFTCMFHAHTTWFRFGCKWHSFCNCMFVSKGVELINWTTLLYYWINYDKIYEFLMKSEGWQVW